MCGTFRGRVPYHTQTVHSSHKRIFRIKLHSLEHLWARRRQNQFCVPDILHPPALHALCEALVFVETQPAWLTQREAENLRQTCGKPAANLDPTEQLRGSVGCLFPFGFRNFENGKTFFRRGKPSLALLGAMQSKTYVDPGQFDAKRAVSCMSRMSLEFASCVIIVRARNLNWEFLDLPGIE